MAPADGADGHPETDATHLDIVRAIGRLEGRTEENFTTLFNVQRAQGVKIDQAVERLARLETRARVRVVAKKPMSWKRAGGIAVIVVTVLGGISGAYHEGVAVLVAIHHALFDAPR